MAKIMGASFQFLELSYAGAAIGPIRTLDLEHRETEMTLRQLEVFLAVAREKSFSGREENPFVTADALRARRRA